MSRDTFLSPAGGAVDSELEAARPTSTGEEELQLQLALAMSKEEHEEEMKRLKGDEVKLQMAIEESRKEHRQPAEVRQPVSQLPLSMLKLPVFGGLILKSFLFFFSFITHTFILAGIMPWAGFRFYVYAIDQI